MIDRDTVPVEGRRGRGNLPAVLTAILGVLAVLFGSLFWMTLKLREQIRAQIVQRDAQVFDEVARMILSEELPGESAGLAPDEPAVLIPAVLRLTAQKGVLGTRLYDSSGEYIMGFPGYIAAAPLPDFILSNARSLIPSSRYHEAILLDSLIDPAMAPAGDASESIHLREITIPLHRSGSQSPAGIAQLLLEGDSIASEFERLDNQLMRTGIWILLCGGLVVTGVLLASWQRVNQSRRLLAERGRILEQTNQELMMALKTSAVGTVTTHLLHGLKSPLAGLKTFALRRTRSTEAASSEWGDVLEVANKMQSMVDNITGMVRNTERDLQNRMPLAEFQERLKKDLTSRFHELRLRAAPLENHSSNKEIEGRTAHLCRFILEELIENACAAAREPQDVELAITPSEHALYFEVSDNGPGIPTAIRDSLFQPVQSSRDGGTGIGLALSRQLAAHMNAQLSLAKTDASGTVFSLVVPFEANKAEDRPDESSRESTP